MREPAALVLSPPALRYRSARKPLREKQDPAPKASSAATGRSSATHAPWLREETRSAQARRM